MVYFADDILLMSPLSLNKEYHILYQIRLLVTGKINKINDFSIKIISFPSYSCIYKI